MTFIRLDLPSTISHRGPRVLLVDDHGPFRAQLRDALPEFGILVVGELDGGELVPLIAPHAGPVVILMDVRMPGTNGIEATEQLRLLGIEAPVVILTGFPEPSIQATARAAGAVDVLVKGAHLTEIAEAIHKAWARHPARLWTRGPHG